MPKPTLVDVKPMGKDVVSVCPVELDDSMQSFPSLLRMASLDCFRLFTLLHLLLGWTYLPENV